MGRKKNESKTQPEAATNQPTETNKSQEDTKPTKERGNLFVVLYETPEEDGKARVKQIAEVESTRAGVHWVRENGTHGNTYGIVRFFASKMRVQQVTSTTIVNLEPA